MPMQYDHTGIRKRGGSFRIKRPSDALFTQKRPASEWKDGEIWIDVFLWFLFVLSLIFLVVLGILARRS